MKLDERFMTILTALLLIVGVGAVLTRGENGSSLVGGGGAFAPKDDSFTLRAGRVQALDVLLNDQNADRVNPEELTVVRKPNCGSALATGGVIQYSESESCVGNVAMSYCVPFEEDCQPTDISLTILAQDDSGIVRGPNSGPQVVDMVAQGVAPREQRTETPAVRPMRLTLPATAEVITPKEATAEVRRIGMADAVESVDQADAAVRVSRTSARSGSVSVVGETLSAPQIAEESAGITIASATDTAPASRPGRPAAPTGLAAANVAPQSPSASFTRPDRPAPALPSPVRTETVDTMPQPPVIATAPPPAQEPAVAPEPAPVEVAAAEPRPEPEPEVVVIVPIEDEPGEAPNAQVELAEPEPDSTGVIASLARSNTVFGATVSAARALFESEEPKPLVTPSATGSRNTTESGTSAPRPREVAAVEQPDIDARELADTSATITRDGRVIDGSPARVPAPVIVAELNAGDVIYEPKTRPAAPLVTLGVVTEEDTEAAAEATPNAIIIEPTRPTEQVAALTVEEEPTADATLDLPEIGTGPAVECEIDLGLQVRVGAEMVASLSSPCRGEQQFLVEHAGLVFSAETDEDGFANFVVPAMTTDAVVRVTFSDGGSTVDRATVESMSRMTRVAVVWTNPVDLNLHAREFNARPGSDKEIRPDNTRDYRMARRAGGGYLTLLGPRDGEGARAEVYTIFETLRTKNGVVEFDLQKADVNAACDAQPVIRVIRSEAGEVTRNNDLRVDLGACGGAKSVDVGIGLRDIRIARIQ